MLIALCILISLMVGFFIGYNHREVKEVMLLVLNREPEQESSVVTALPPDYADVNNNSAIITPKTPAEIDFQEQERVRNL